MISIRELDHVVLRVRDLEPMLGFYRDVLGCAVERRDEGLGLVQLRAGRSLIDLVPATGPPPGRDGHNLDHFCVRVEPFDEAELRAHLEAHAIEVDELARRYGAEGFGPSIYIRDPEGNTVELKGPPEAPAAER